MLLKVCWWTVSGTRTNQTIMAKIKWVKGPTINIKPLHRRPKNEQCELHYNTWRLRRFQRATKDCFTNDSRRVTCDKLQVRTQPGRDFNKRTISVIICEIDVHRLHLGCCLRYKEYTIVITRLLTIAQHPYIIWEWIFSLLPRMFPSITDKTIIGHIYG